MAALLIQGQIGIVIGMDEEVRVGLEVRHARTQEVEVFVGNEIDLSAVAIRVESRDSTELHPRPESPSVLLCFEHDLVVIAEQRDEAASLRQIDQRVEHAFGVDAPIHMIAERDDRVILLRIDGGKDRGKSVRTAVDVSDGDCAGEFVIHCLPLFC